MSIDRTDADEWMPRAAEMPGLIIDMINVDGRLYVTLADGRTIDMTDWFADPAHLRSQ